VGLSRKACADPACVACVDALPEAVRQLAPRRDAPAHALRIGLAQSTRVPVRPDRQDGVELLDLEAVHLGDERQLFLRGLTQGDHVGPFHVDSTARVCAGAERLAVELTHERRGDRPCVDSDDLPRLQLE
jgi:hypothetical protein